MNEEIGLGTAQAKPSGTVLYMLCVLLGLFWGGLISHVLLPTVFQTSAIALVPWGLTAFALGVLAKSKHQCMYGGILYGLCLALSFTLPTVNYREGIFQVAVFVGVIGILSIVSSILGLVLGYFVKNRMRGL